MNKRLKVIAIASFIMLALALLLAWNNPATGYELDIYASTPVQTWVLIVLAMLVGAGIIIQQVVTRGYDTGRTWILGLFLLVLSRVAILSLPHIRGYFAFRGDNITHFGMVKDIISTGHFSDANFYPITHTLLSQVSSVTGISQLTIFNLGTAFLSPFFFIFTYLLAKAVLPERGQQLAAVTVVTLLFPAVYVTPNNWSLFFLPLILFCYFKRTVPAYGFLLIILLVLYPFFHPLSSFMVIIALAVIEITKLVFVLLSRGKYSLSQFKFTLVPLFIEVIVFSMWILSFRLFDRNIRLLWQQITTFTTPDVLGGIGSTLEKIEMVGLDLVTLYIKLYGVQTILIVFSLVALFFVIEQIRSHFSVERAPIFYLSAIFLFYGFLYLLYLLGLPGASSWGGHRVLSYVLIFTPVLTGFGIYEIFRRFSFHKLVVGSITAIIVAGTILAVLKVYPSPYITRPNPQVTQMEMTGMERFIEEKDVDVAQVNIMTELYRFADGVIGYVEREKRVDLKSREQLSDHFAYEENNSLGEQFPDDRYAIITSFDRLVYVTIWQIVGRFNNADFERLEKDPTVNRLYSNGEFDVYFISADVTQ